jgi:hypothetical protein
LAGKIFVFKGDKWNMSYLEERKEQTMIDEDSSQTADAAADGTDSSVEGSLTGGLDKSPPTGVSSGQPESSTKGMLRDAIQKVMDEIAFHEREAKKHLQMAEELRKDLRGSFAFLQEREGKAKPAGIPAASAPAKTTEPPVKEKSKNVTATGKRPRAKTKKK